MYSKINEKIEVLCAYVKNKSLPLYFRWGEKKYKVDKVNLVHSMRRGRDKLYFYSVSNKDNFFKLCFDTEKNQWMLVERFCQ
ncbi:TPA: hypothetical protein DF272_06240 [Candidatus Falkowbacteria bacterium]|nr:hypothetical protein [Candidatus Falkowbacteria bacterium]